MQEDNFNHYASLGYTRVPVYSELMADLDTPLSTFKKLGAAKNTFLFESVQGGEKWGRYSIIGLASDSTIEVRENTVTIKQGEVVQETLQVDDPLQWIDDYQQQFSVPDVPGLPTVTGGLVGYFGYDTIRYIEPKLGRNTKPDPIDTPDILLMVSEELVVFDNLAGKLFIILLTDPTQPNAYQAALAKQADIRARLRQPLTVPPSVPGRPIDEADFESGFTEEGYKEAVRVIRQHITDGDCMQVVLSQRLSIPFDSDPLDLYRALRLLNPSPYLYYLNLGDHQIVGSSPEILVRVEQGEVTVRPLAGTRPRGKTAEEDLQLERDLLADPKELAEHLMLIDLGRNDIGRIAKNGSVTLTDKMSVERYSHVMHIVSNVVGEVRDEVTGMDVLRATFPAGTLSGAPKVRAMEIIQDLEPVKRGIYSGFIGYLSWNGNMDTAIAIRTAVIKDGVLNIQAGAGIVYDSVPETEWAETMSKARAVFRAVKLASAGLDDPSALSAVQNPALGAAGAAPELTAAVQETAYATAPPQQGQKSTPTSRPTSVESHDGLVVVIDNYDSFTYNLVQYLGELGANVTVVRNDQCSLAELDALKPARLLLSPGPGRPEDAGITLEAIAHFAGKIPILGVCLGHQCIGQYFGGRITHAGEIMHGKLSSVYHDDIGVFEGSPSPLTATRYHSLVIDVDSVPDVLEITAWTLPPSTDPAFANPTTQSDNTERVVGEVMGVRHRELAIEGVQFHPESISSEYGYNLMKRFLGVAVK